MKKTKILCPTCREPIEWNDKFPNKPFCSDRCKLIDLGAWANNEHKIAGRPADFTISNSEDEQHKIN